MSGITSRLKRSRWGEALLVRSAPLRSRFAATIGPTSPTSPTSPTGAAVGLPLQVRSRPHRPFDSHWRELSDWRAQPPARIAVVIHVFYPELVHEILTRVSGVPVPVDIIITNSSGKPLVVDADLPAQARCLTLDMDNRGRDILPLVELANASLLDPYDLVLKVHTKRSRWREGHALPGSGASWRDTLLESLLGDPEQISAILTAFAEDRSLGLVTADESILGPEYWGDNQELTRGLLDRLEIPLAEDQLRFAAGSMYWVRGFVLAGLRSLELTPDDFPPEEGQVNQTTAHALERTIGILVEESGMQLHGAAATAARKPTPKTLAHRFHPSTARDSKVRAISFYLPQFHPIAENNAWWGEGFTEWNNVTRGVPLYRGHYQPRLPEGLGFYDLRTPETVETQCALAESAGLSGFMYYNYWFSGHPLLELPINNRLSDDTDFPFCLLWANENWTRTWDGGVDDILLAQDHSSVPPEEYLRSVLPILADDRYLRVGGKALLGVYRPRQLPDPPGTFRRWRELAREHGVGELLLIAVDGNAEFGENLPEPERMGLDATFRFAPHGLPWEPMEAGTVDVAPGVHARIWSYRVMVDRAIRSYESEIDAHHFPGVMVAFDNTARRQHLPDIWYGSNPYTYHRWLSSAVEAVIDRPRDERIVFINAWNEWAESAVLEPTDKYGLSFLVATRSALTR